MQTVETGFLKFAVLISTLVVVSHLEAGDSDLDNWIATEQQVATQKILANLSPADGRKGAVIASPSRSNPNYYFHWIRDSALTMGTVAGFGAPNDATALLQDYVSFSLINQSATPGTFATFGIGEPVYKVDGTLRDDPWGRPQNDGPGLRALVLSAFARKLIQAGQLNYVQTNLYDGKAPGQTQSVIKVDLEYVGHHWTDACFDLWEEVQGIHFYTRMIQHRALLVVSDLANQLNDGGAATFYTQQAQLLETEINQHWSPQSGYILASLQTSRTGFKPSQLDSCVILAVLHSADSSKPFFAPDDERVLATASKLISTFGPLYQINARRANGNMRALQPGIGRYPEDTYNGYQTTSLGNPWFLSTAALAELCYRVTVTWANNGQIPVTVANVGFIKSAIASEGNVATVVPGETITAADSRFGLILCSLVEFGDGFLRRVKEHSDQNNGSLSEEFNRDNGYMQGANDLTWSYVSFLTAVQQRANALAVVPGPCPVPAPVN